ncbi:MAG TPA: hypothetical protein VMV10_04760 [Pirellulales bacterium]|nr:hypothetical protein [Pirellulales bacterium]
MTDLYAAWLERAGVQIPRRADGSAAVPIEISPLAALNASELRDLPAGPLARPFLLESP